jgi:hypothetical protein
MSIKYFNQSFFVSLYDADRPLMMTTVKVNNFIDSQKLSRKELYGVHRHIGNMIQKRMFYQLVVNVPWKQTREFYDHTDRFEEIIDELVTVTVDCINQSGCVLSSLPENIFILNHMKNTVIGMRADSHDEQIIYNIFKTLLDNGYHYEIQQHEVEFSYVDPYYK